MALSVARSLLDSVSVLSFTLIFIMFFTLPFLSLPVQLFLFFRLTSTFVMLNFLDFSHLVVRILTHS